MRPVLRAPPRRLAFVAVGAGLLAIAFTGCTSGDEGAGVGVDGGSMDAAGAGGAPAVTGGAPSSGGMLTGGNGLGGSEPADASAGGAALLDGSPSDASLDGGPVAPAVFARSGLTARPLNATCFAIDPPAAGLATEPLFDSGANMNGLLDLHRGPASIPSWWGITKSGNLRVLPDGAVSATPLVTSADLDALVTSGEQGLLGLAVEPTFPSVAGADTVRLYVYYSSDNCAAGAAQCSRLRRVVADVSGSPYSVTSDEELFEVRQPATNHNGGALRFGPDGMLYVSLGDGGSGNDPSCAGQNVRTPLGKILRIDVSAATGYTIPEGNPFKRDPTGTVENPLCNAFDTQGSSGVPDLGRAAPCPEVFALGLRNPFRMSFDRATGQLWIGDVGQDEVEEIDVLDPSVVSTGYATPMFNFGWPLREGPDAKTNGACSALFETYTQYTQPAFFIRHSDNGSRGVIVGGAVYRGSALDGTYVGNYFFQDAQSGENFNAPDPYTAVLLDYDGFDNALTDAAYGYTEDDQGELILLSVGATPRKIVPGSTGNPSFPTLLSQTGCFDGSDPRVPASGLIPYDLNSPLWSDGAVKERYLAVPDGTMIAVQPDGDFDLPVGSVLAKVFRAASGELLETRLLMHNSDGLWRGYAFEWDAAGTEATLTDRETLVASHGWTIPSRSQCLQCHTPAAGFSLGLEVAQLNRNLRYTQTGLTANQLATLSDIGVLDLPVPDGGTLEQLADPANTAAPLGDRARSYLHANCGGCHRPGTPIASAMDLRYSTPLTATSTCGLAPTVDTWPVGTLLLTPGGPSASLIHVRMTATDGTRMPRIGTRVVDPVGTGVVGAWITSLGSCP